MIVNLFRHSFEYVTDDGWVCHQPTEDVTVTRDDGSSELMSIDKAMLAVEAEGFKLP